MAQAVSDLSAYTSFSRQLWNQLAVPYNTCSVMCETCAALYVTQKWVGTCMFGIASAYNNGIYNGSLCYKPFDDREVYEAIGDSGNIIYVNKDMNVSLGLIMKKTGIEAKNGFCYRIDSNSYLNNMLYRNKETDG